MLISCSAAAFAGTGNGDLTDANINYVGRWDKTSGTTYRSYWGGAYVSAKFTGTTVKVKLAEPTRFMAVIDGVATSYWNASGTIDLTSTPLANGTHTLKIIAKYQDVELPFQGLVLDTGAFTLRADSLPLVEFIGDSITAGETTTDYAVSAYAWQAGERLGADHTQIAYPGITLSDGYHYDWNNWPGMESLYFKLQQANHCPDVACAANPLWDFSKYTAKIVVINIGTNDGNNSVPSATFQGRYTTFLQNVRAKYPNAEIFALRPFGGYYQTETQAAVSARLDAGDGRLHYVDTTGWLQSPGDFTDGLHPNDAGHIKVTNRLLPILLPYIGVATLNDNDSKFGYDDTADWPGGSQTGAYQDDNHWSSVANAFYKVPFNGTQVRLFGGKAPSHGIAAVSVDGGAETLIDTYAATRADGVPLWSSPVLSPGKHTLKVRVTGQKNASSSNTFVTADRVDVVNGGVNLLGNAGFEAGSSGWNVVSSGTGQSFIDTTKPKSGSSHLKHASTVPYWVATSQTLTGLRNGLYTLRAWVRGTAGHELYVKNFGSDSMAVTSSASKTYTQLVIKNVKVTNGSAEIGIWTSDDAGTSWLDIDDMTFYRQ